VTSNCTGGQNYSFDPSAQYRNVGNPDLFLTIATAAVANQNSEPNLSLSIAAHVAWGVGESTATHLAKKRRWSSALPADLPAAGLPGSRGGKALATKIEQALATSAVTAGALVVWQPRITTPTKRSVRTATGFI
jgi:hypothetical protein